MKEKREAAVRMLEGQQTCVSRMRWPELSKEQQGGQSG